MFALRPQQPALHDENAGAGLLRSFRDKENGPAGAGLGNSKPLFGKASTTSLLGGKLNQSSAPLGTRKALGNITNTNGGSDPSENMGGKLLGKGAAVKPEGRRAFGDLTNSALSASTRPAPAKPSLSLNQSLKPATQVSAKSAVQPPQSKAEKLAAGGIERLAGKSWAQMEAERVASQEKNLQQKVGILKSAIASWGMTSSLKECLLPEVNEPNLEPEPEPPVQFKKTVLEPNNDNDAPLITLLPEVSSNFILSGNLFE